LNFFNSKIYFIFNIFFIISSVLFISCKQGKNKGNSLFGNNNIEEDSTKYESLEIGLQTIKVNEIPVDIIVPDRAINGDLLVLSGWNFTRDRWCNESDLCTKALAKGYRLIMPEMGRSVYSSKYFPQTREDWIIAPTGTWLVDTMIKHLQIKYGILLPGKRNYLIGLSTGGRGVALTAIRTGKLFKAGIALSGDYDNILIPYDAVITGFYGTYEDNKEIWETIDNPYHDAALLQVPLYLGHGLNDPVVPSQQSIAFYKKLQEVNPDLKVVLHISETGLHDFSYWNSEVNVAFKFIEEY
jgi:pimeloyl-ACP methyl ester carboxylesterase